MLNRDPERAGSCCWAIAERGTCPFLNDVYILCQPPRAHVLDNLLEATSQPGEDEGKEQGRHRSGEHRGHQPGSMAASRDQSSWHTDKMSERIAKERELWDAIPTFPDLQCAWQFLLQNANPRANHTMRTLPPSVSRGQCEAHDEGIWSTAKQRQTPKFSSWRTSPCACAVWDCGRRRAALELRSGHRGQTRCR